MTMAAAAPKATRTTITSCLRRRRLDVARETEAAAHGFAPRCRPPWHGVRTEKEQHAAARDGKPEQARPETLTEHDRQRDAGGGEQHTPGRRESAHLIRVARKP